MARERKSENDLLRPHVSFILRKRTTDSSVPISLNSFPAEKTAPAEEIGLKMLSKVHYFIQYVVLRISKFFHFFSSG